MDGPLVFRRFCCAFLFLMLPLMQAFALSYNPSVKRIDVNLKNIKYVYVMQLKQGTVYLGAQPFPPDYALLRQRFHIQSVIDLKTIRQVENEEKLVKGVGIPYFLRLPLDLANFDGSTYRRLSAYFSVPQHFPIYMHAIHGNRPAMIMSLYVGDGRNPSQLELSNLAIAYGLNPELASSVFYAAIFAVGPGA